MRATSAITPATTTRLAARPKRTTATPGTTPARTASRPGRRRSRTRRTPARTAATVETRGASPVARCSSAGPRSRRMAAAFPQMSSSPATSRITGRAGRTSSSIPDVRPHLMVPIPGKRRGFLRRAAVARCGDRSPDEYSARMWVVLSGRAAIIARRLSAEITRGEHA